MTRRARRIAVSFCVLSALTLLVAAADEPIDEVNLFIGEVSALPAEPIGSGDVLQLDVELRIEGQGLLASDPRLALALRRQDKPEACITELEVVPREELQDDGSYIVSFAVDTLGLSGGRYEVVAEIEWDGLEASKLDNRQPIGFVIIADPRPELHPVELRTDPAVPVQWGETGTVHTTIANTGRLRAGAFHVVFELRPKFTSGEADPSTGESSPSDTTNAFCDWILVASRLVPGLARNEEVRVSAALDVALLLQDAQAYWTGGTSCALPPLSQLRTRGLDFDLRVRVVYPTPDVEQAVQELDPLNNEILGAWSVVPSDLGRSDLVPVYIAFDEDLPLNWDDAMTASVVVANIGGRTTETGFSVRFSYRRVGDAVWRAIGPDQDGDGTADDRRVPDPLPIEAGANDTRVGVTIDPRGVAPGLLPLEPGSYELRVDVDANDEVAERNEDNNTLIVGFSVRGTELQAEGLELPSSEIRQGSSLIVKAWVLNTGDRPATDFAVGFYLNDERFATFVYTDAEGLREDERTQVQGVLDTRDLPPASYDLRVIVDPDDRIPEYDEGNNEASTPIQIHPPAERLAELHITDLRLEPPSPIARGSVVTCRLTVRNAGEIDADGFRLLLETSPWRSEELEWGPYTPVNLAGVLVGTLIPALERGEASSIEVAFSTEALVEGRYRLRVCADADGEIAESNESNNETIVLFAIGQPVSLVPDVVQSPNLTCSELTVSPATQVEPGTVLTITGAIANAGGAPAATSVVALRWMDPLGNMHTITSRRIEALGPGQQAPFSFSVDTTGYLLGAQAAFVVADWQDSVVEANEVDNECAVGVQLGASGYGLPDLVPVSVRFDSPGATVGEHNAVEQNQRLYVYVTVRNDGNIPSGPFVVAFGTPLGVDAEQWPGVGPQDQTEVSYPVPTGTPGEFALSIQVDPDGLIPEANEANNAVPNAYIAALPTYTVVGLAAPKPRRIVPPDSGGLSDAPVRWLAADAGSQHVYAVWADGDIGRIRVDTDAAELVARLAVSVTDVVMAFGATAYAYVGAGDGSFRRVNLDTGTVSATAELGEPIVAIVLGDGGRVYAAVEDGFYELSLSGTSYGVSRLVDVPGDVVDIRYDDSRQLVYILSDAGLHAYGIDLASRCRFGADEILGVPDAFALGGSGNFLAASAGSGAILYAVSHCTVTGDDTGHILAGWRYPRSGTLSGGITSVVVDPRDIDPIYAATDAGAVCSLGFDGTMQWVRQVGSPIRSTPLADKRTGRIFFGDDDGIPHILTLDGIEIELDLAGYAAAAIRSTLVIVETRERTDFGTRLIRNYYYGTEDGVVYKIASQQ